MGPLIGEWQRQRWMLNRWRWKMREGMKGVSWEGSERDGIR